MSLLKYLLLFVKVTHQSNYIRANKVPATQPPVTS